MTASDSGDSDSARTLSGTANLTHGKVAGKRSSKAVTVASPSLASPNSHPRTQ